MLNHKILVWGAKSKTLILLNMIKNRCVTHDDKNIFYFDDSHPSLKGAEMINDLIMKEIEKIELN